MTTTRLDRPKPRSTWHASVLVATLVGVFGLLSTGTPTSAATANSSMKASTFKLTSPAMTDGGALPIRLTCDGASSNPSVSWTGAPKGTKSFAVVMHHVPGPGDVHWYWVVYAIPSTVNRLDEASTRIGTLGTNSVNGRNEYAPPCSKGPGPKPYTLTVYALSKAPTFAPGTAVSRDVLLSAIAKTTLASSSMTVTYERAGTTAPPVRPAASSPPSSVAPTQNAATVTGVIYADNWFQLYVNGALIATDPTPFKPFDVIPVSFPAVYPMTIAIVAKDYADPVTGLEYDNTKVGDGGLIARFSNGVATSSTWKTLVVSRGPLNLDRCLAVPAECKVDNIVTPSTWFTPSFDANAWTAASVFTREQVQPHADDFDRPDWSGASFIWSKDFVLDNTVLFRTTVAQP